MRRPHPSALCAPGPALCHLCDLCRTGDRTGVPATARGRRRRWPMHAVLNGMLHALRIGSAWLHPPPRLPDLADRPALVPTPRVRATLSTWHSACALRLRTSACRDRLQDSGQDRSPPKAAVAAGFALSRRGPCERDLVRNFGGPDRDRVRIQDGLRRQDIDKYRQISWLPFLDTYRPICLAPEPPLRRILEEIQEMLLAA